MEQRPVLTPVFPESGVSYSKPAFTPEGHVHTHGVSWAAVIAGAFVTASLSLIMLSLGAGLGLSSVSPWAHTGASASTIKWATIAWIVLMQVIASAMGGYLAGRLRTKWVSIHSDEVYFRDTAHGFLAWAVAVVVTAGFLASAAASMAGGMANGAMTSAAIASTSASSQSGEPQAYFVDMLFRTDRPVAPSATPDTDASTASAPASTNDAATRAEAGRIFINALPGDMSSTDQAYLAQLISAKTGMSQADAAQRVQNVIAQAKQTADKARQAGARLSLWIFVALLTGAFCASVAATIGGSQRDNVVVI